MRSIRDQIVVAARRKILYTQHALDQMNKPERLISRKEVEQVVFQGEIVEDYAEDSRGQSCLMLGKTNIDRFIHVVCAPKTDYLAIITAYPPNKEEWSSDFKKRKR